MSSQGVMSSKEAGNNPGLFPIKRQQSGLIRVHIQSFSFYLFKHSFITQLAGILRDSRDSSSAQGKDKKEILYYTIFIGHLLFVRLYALCWRLQSAHNEDIDSAGIREDVSILSSIKEPECTSRMKTTKSTANVNCECSPNVILRFIVTSKNAVSDLIREKGLTALCPRKFYGSQFD
jgi:hypothetical protein